MNAADAVRRPDDAPAPATRSLLIAPQWIGDAVMAQPLVSLLAARGERVTAVALPGVAPVLRAMPGVADVIEAPFAHGRLDWSARRALAAQLRRRGFERAYILGNNLKSRLVPWLARIPERIGWRGEAAGLLLSHPMDRRRPQPEPMSVTPVSCRMPADDAPGARADMRRHYAWLAGDAGRTGGLPEPTLQVDAATADAVRVRFGLPARWIALCPGAEYGPAKQWPVEHWGALARMAMSEGFGVAVLGAPRDAQAGDAIAAAAPGTFNLCGKTSMDKAIALLADCTGAVSNDSGLMHVAAALGRPTVGVYGSTDPRHTPPAAHRSATLWLHLDCSPCFQRECPLGHLRCLHGIAPETVWSRCADLMAATSSAP